MKVQVPSALLIDENPPALSLDDDDEDLYSVEPYPLNANEIEASKLIQGYIFDIEEYATDAWWKQYWKGMPEFSLDDLTPHQSITLHFFNQQSISEFVKLVGQKITEKTKSIWYPENKLGTENFKYSTNAIVIPRYPIYVISKGRWESRLTSKALEKMNVPYRIVIEPQEYDNYASVISPDKILILPFSNLGHGSIPARNWVWEHSLLEGHERHWILDDNISGFVRLNRNLKVSVDSGAMFRAAEDFADRFENVALSGFNYRFFAEQRSIQPPFRLNTRIYSCILIKNDIPYRWRGRYNEDTDLSIRTLKDGWCTVLFQAFLCNKAATMTVKGGNTEELYADDGRLKMAQSLQEQHPDVARVSEKWGRVQHHVDYRQFKDNKLILKSNVQVSDVVNDYGMVLRRKIETDDFERPKILPSPLSLID